MNTLENDWLSFIPTYYIHNSGFDYNFGGGFHSFKGHSKPEEQCRKEIAKRRKRKKMANKNRKRR